MCQIRYLEQNVYISLYQYVHPELMIEVYVNLNIELHLIAAFWSVEYTIYSIRIGLFHMYKKKNTGTC